MKKIAYLVVIALIIFLWWELTNGPAAKEREYQSCAQVETKKWRSFYADNPGMALDAKKLKAHIDSYCGKDPEGNK